MDAIALIFYALVCGILGWAGPHLGRPPVRFGVGVLVGLAAASLLPVVRQMIG